MPHLVSISAVTLPTPPTPTTATVNVRIFCQEEIILSGFSLQKTFISCALTGICSLKMQYMLSLFVFLNYYQEVGQFTW